jgi:hypothetical protein
LLKLGDELGLVDGDIFGVAFGNGKVMFSIMLVPLPPLFGVGEFVESLDS